MLIECQKRVIFGSLTNMHELYFSDEKKDATAVPYTYSDYLPVEAGNTINKRYQKGKKQQERQLFCKKEN